MITRKQKEEQVKEFADRFERQHIAILSDFHGISVGALQTLRRNLRSAEGEYKVVRKTLADRALAEKGLKLRTKDTKGQVGIAFGFGDAVTPAQILQKFAKEHNTFNILGGILGNLVMDAKDVLALAKLPSREALLGQVASILQAPIRNLAAALQANIRNLAIVIHKVQEQKT